MLQQLYIQNYIIIDELTVKPGVNLNVITGETGAGKSIILGALGLILGERADAATLMNKEVKCVVEAQFHVADNDYFLDALKNEDLDEEPVCIIRREIGANGKSRAFINDTPVTLSVLSKLTSLLVDLHQQFGHLALKEDNFQMDVLDAVANNKALKKEYVLLYTSYKKVSRQIVEHKATQLQFQQEADYKQFLFDELEEASFRAHEIEEVEGQLKQFAHSERILTTLQSVKMILNEGEQPLLNELRRAMQQLQAISDVLAEVDPLRNRIGASYEELKDVLNELEIAESNIAIDPENMNRLQERLDMGYKLLKKHGASTTADLQALHHRLSEELQTTQNLTETIAQLEVGREKIFTELQKTAGQLSKNRKKVISALETKLNELLKLVGMPNAHLKIEIQTLTEPDIHGLDSIVFLLDANKSGVFTPVYKAASGGEMSRIMLSIKSITAKAMQMPTLIFDEVDTGISGEAARQVGILLKDLALYHQVVCITHQPQVAAKADTHFYVYKDDGRNERITANLRKLNDKEHIYAIAQMIGGENPSDIAMKNAKELITL